MSSKTFQEAAFITYLIILVYVVSCMFAGGWETSNAVHAYHHVDRAERKTRRKGNAVMGVPDRNK